MVGGRPSVEMTLQHLAAIEESIGSLACKIGINIKSTLPQHGEIEILVVNSQIESARPAWEVLANRLAVGRGNLIVTIEIFVANVAQLLCSGTLWSIVELGLRVEETISHIAIERANRLSFHKPIKLVVGVFTIGSFQIRNLVVYIRQVQIHSIAQILTQTIVVEHIQIEARIAHASGILRGWIHTNHTLDRELQQHVVGVLLIK